MLRIVSLIAGLFLIVRPVASQDALLDSLTLEQRIGQMFMVTLHGAQITEVGQAFLEQWQPGAVVLFTSNVGTPAAMTRLTNAYQQTMRDQNAVPLLIAIDQEGGLVQRLTDGFTQLPGPLILTGAGRTDMPYNVSSMVAEELSAVGINMNLAPVADLETYRENPIIRLRSFGNDPQIAGDALAKYVQGLQAGGVVATLKHFPGHGDTREDSHGELPMIRLDRERLESVEIESFRHGINAGAEVVLVAHIWYSALEPQPGLPASLSHNIVTGILRDELGFDGVVMTDAIDMSAVDLNFSYEEAVLKAVEAGVDIITAGPSIGLPLQERMMQALLDAVQRGEISEERINQSVRRILSVKERYGLFDWQPLDPASADQRVNAENHATVIDDLFNAGTAIAYDRNDLLPLTPDRNAAIIFLATRYQIQNECSTYGGNIRWVGVGDSPSRDEIGWATEAANQSDVAVVFTQNAIYTKEQQDLVNALPPEKTVAVALFSPYDWTTYPNVAAYMTTNSPMRPAVPAACALLFGAIPAQGQLAVTLAPELPAGSRAD
ncbi:MAG: glycoside hydrolase family 3 protein [Anaerolineae bacterium]|nr:glycoside hydrolase family 3 protein [Anaerolineae bacterium]